MDERTYNYAEKRYEPTYFDGEYQGHRVKTETKAVGTEVEPLESLESRQKLQAYREKIVELQKKFEQSCSQGLQHRKERDEHFQNFREACRVGLKHREERNDATRALSKVMKENERLRKRNSELQDRVDGLFRALHHKPFDCDDQELPKSRGSVYLWLMLAASAVASVPVVQAICVAAGIE